MAPFQLVFLKSVSHPSSGTFTDELSNIMALFKIGINQQLIACYEYYQSKVLYPREIALFVGIHGRVKIIVKIKKCGLCVSFVPFEAFPFPTH